MLQTIVQYINKLTIKQMIVSSVVVIMVFSLLITNLLWNNQYRSEMEEQVVDKARSIISIGEAFREYTNENWSRGLFDKKELVANVRGKFLYAVPIFSSITAMNNKAQALGYEFRVPAPRPRNAKNKPDEFEQTALDKIARENLQEYYAIDSDRGAIRYFKPIRLSRDCLICHGDPARSKALWNRDDGKDPTGFRMEGWKDGEIHGAFELIYPLNHIDAAQMRMFLLALGFSLVVLAAVVLLVYIVLKKSFDPIEQIVQSLQRINKNAGDLTQKIEILRNDEVGQIAYFFNEFLDHLSSIIKSVRDTADAISLTSDEMAQTSHDLANVAQDQAASIEETSSSMVEIKSTIDSVSENAGGQSKKASSTRASMEYLYKAINSINKDAQEANRRAIDTHNYAKDGEQVLHNTVESIDEITRSSNKINDIVTIISDISDKINLLSLNASIEAARAGEHGKGFAVVAEEISKLADQTATSSKEINRLIHETNSKVDIGYQLVEKTSASLRMIIENVGQTAVLMENIAKSSIELTDMSGKVNTEVLEVNDMSEEISLMMQEQSLASNEIISAIDQINEITVTVASGTEELAAASGELNLQANRLRDVFKDFRF